MSGSNRGQASRAALQLGKKQRLKPQRTPIHVFMILVTTGTAVGGCNHSRYGITYDERLPGIKRVAVLPAKVEVYSRHTGGALEPRKDLEPGVLERTMATVEEILVERGYEPVVLPAPEVDDRNDTAVAQRLALLAAIEEGIVTHHYQHGKAILLDYNTGDSAAVLAGESADAVLCIHLRGIVPTSGREALMATAVVIGVLTGINIAVATNEAVMTLLLFDADTGEVLWFNLEHSQAHVGGEHRLRRFVQGACRYLLKPRD